jgi:hypothetical protein
LRGTAWWRTQSQSNLSQHVKFHPNREKYREFCANKHNGRMVAIKKSRQSGTFDEIP